MTAPTLPGPKIAPVETGRAASPEGDLPSLRSEELLRGAREIIIRHRDDRYRLLLTSNDKLILVK